MDGRSGSPDGGNPRSRRASPEPELHEPPESPGICVAAVQASPERFEADPADAPLDARSETPGIADAAAVQDDGPRVQTLRVAPQSPADEPAVLHLEMSGAGRANPKEETSRSTATLLPDLGRVAFEGPCGRLEHLRIAEVDSPESIEHCLRTAFKLPYTARVLVRDASGCAVPLGAGLLKSPAGTTNSDGTLLYHVEVSLAGFEEVGGSLGACSTRALAASILDTSKMRLMEPSMSGDSLDEEKEVLQQALRKKGRVDSGRNKSHIDASTATPGSAESEANSVQPNFLLPNSVHQGKELLSPPESQSCDLMSSGQMMSSGGQWMSTVALQDEFEFWVKLLESSSSDASDLSASWRPPLEDSTDSRNRLKLFQRSAPFDTSPQHIDAMYDAWVDNDGLLRTEVLHKHLESEHHIALNSEQLEAALRRARDHFSDVSLLDDGKVPRIVFASLWQRLVLGIVCQQGSISTEPHIRLIEYTERSSLLEKHLSERSFLFGGHSKGESGQVQGALHADPTTRWAWVETSSSELLMRMAVKFFLHPLAAEDMLKAARQGTTKIDRYRHQYFVSLEVYALDAKAALEADPSPGELLAKEEKRPTKDRITRSTISLLATGSPPTRSKPSTVRDWLLTVINYVDKKTGTDPDPLDCFQTDQTAASKVLASIRDDLKAHKRQREYQADFLLYSIIDRAASELTPIYNAYGRRLRWLQTRLEKRQLSMPKSYLDEVSKVRHELQELRQWLGQLWGIVHHLECDCHGGTDSTVDEAPWHFGADALGQGQSMRVFLRHTQVFLEQAADRLSVLDDLARTFTASTERYKSDSMNQALFVLTVATAVFLPAQFLAGVYGMNFQSPNGKPGIPELSYEHGYLVFWLVAGTLLLGLPVLTCLCLRCRGLLARRSLCQGRAAAGRVTR